MLKYQWRENGKRKQRFIYTENIYGNIFVKMPRYSQNRQPSPTQHAGHHTAVLCLVWREEIFTFGLLAGQQQPALWGRKQRMSGLISRVIKPQHHSTEYLTLQMCKVMNEDFDLTKLFQQIRIPASQTLVLTFSIHRLIGQRVNAKLYHSSRGRDRQV